MKTVFNFGAVGDGITDDTVAIQAAVDSGHAIHFPPGNYKMDSGITSKRRSYGERLLRAAAKGEDTSKIKREIDPPYFTMVDMQAKSIGELYEYTKNTSKDDHATDAASYSFTGSSFSTGDGS